MEKRINAMIETEDGRAFLIKGILINSIEEFQDIIWEQEDDIHFGENLILTAGEIDAITEVSDELTEEIFNQAQGELKNAN